MDTIILTCIVSSTKTVFIFQNIRAKLLHLPLERDILHNRQRIHGLGKNGRGLFVYKRRDIVVSSLRFMLPFQECLFVLSIRYSRNSEHLASLALKFRIGLNPVDNSQLIVSSLTSTKSL